jgi:hypothetical protein
MDVFQPKLERHMRIDHQSERDDGEQPPSLDHGVEFLSVAWSMLPPPVKLVIWAAAVAVAAPLISGAADRLDVEPGVLLMSVAMSKSSLVARKSPRGGE